MPGGTQYLVAVRAAWMRVGMGVTILVVLPIILPATAQHRWLFAIYAGLGVGTQFLVWRDLGGELRTAVMGMIDMCMLTFLVHRLGSLSSMIVLLYVFFAMLYALAVRRSIAIWLAAFASATYVAVLTLEFGEALPYGPDAPGWAIQPATGRTMIAAGIMVSVLTIGAAITVANLVQLLRNREDQLEDLSRRDSLTQLSNRRHLLERVDIELARVRRGHPLALLMIDLDGFKQINDAHGHLRGDELLAAMADGLRQATRETDVVARYGGDEFAVLLPDTDSARANGVAERLVTALREVGTQFDDEHVVTASIGLAIAHADDDANALLRRADDNGYQAKRDGGDRLVVSDAA